MEIARLTATTQGDTIAFLVPATRPLTLGRSSRCGLRLRDPKVSREHCCLTFFGGDLLVNDLGSAHGLTFHGERNDSFRLRVGDGFHLGRTFVRFEALDVMDEADLPAPPSANVGDEAGDEADDRAGDDGGNEAGAAAAPVARPATPPAVPPAAPAPVAAIAAVPWHDLQPGTELGGFLLDTVLGRSDRATVFRAHQVQLQRRVALKVLRHRVGQPADTGERTTFLADVRTAASVLDPSIVPVFDIAETEGECFASLELVDGQSLAAALAHGGCLPWRDLLPVLTDVLQALTVLHDRGRVHGGIKASNVFVLPKGGARLADARATPRPRPGENDALPAPEQRRGDAVDARTDLFAVGSLAWLALTGQRPDDSSRTSPPSPNELQRLDGSLPPKLAALVGKLLTADPSARPASAAQVRDELLALRGPERRSAPVRSDASAPASPNPSQGPRPSSTPRPEVVRHASAGKRFAARFTSEMIIVSMILGIGIVLLVGLRAVNPDWDIYKLFDWLRPAK